jgi:hypothetical protein
MTKGKVIIHVNIASKLSCAYPLLCIENTSYGEKPFLNIDFCVVEYCTDRYTIGCITVVTMIAAFAGQRKGIR